MKPIRPIHDLGSRIREQGRLRMGVKTGKAMKALKHWRFTSPERAPLDQLAVIYGGEVKPWSDPKAGQGPDQFELLSTSSQIRVFIPPNGLSTWYELWSGGGVKRRCDGAMCQIDGDPQRLAPCLCIENQHMECKPKTRLAVVLPEVRPFGGVWRLDTGSWNAADEMAAMERLLDQLQVQGLVEAQLLIEPRSRMVQGRKKNYVVPVILISSSADLALGAAQDGRMLIEGAEQPALPAPTPTPPVSSLTKPDDDEPVDAEVVETPGYDRAAMDTRLTVAIDLIAQRTEHRATDLEVALALGGSKGAHNTLKDLTDDQHRRAVEVAERIAQGKVTIKRIEDRRLILG